MTKQKKSKSNTKRSLTSDNSNPKSKMPVGVITFGVIHIVIYTMTIVSTLISLYDSLALERTAKILSLSYEYLIISKNISLLIAIFALSAGIMILSRKRLGRTFMINVAIVSIIIGVLNTAYIFSTLELTGPLGSMALMAIIIGFIIGTIYQGLVIWYFNRKRIRKLFS